MIATAAKVEVRHPDGIWEVPLEVWPGMLPKLDCSWVWIISDHESPKTQAVLITAPAHGIVILLRLWKAKDAPAMLLRGLFEAAAKEAMKRGMLGWMCQVSGVNRTELKLAKLMLRFKGGHYPVTGLLGFGKLEDVCQKPC